MHLLRHGKYVFGVKNKKEYCNYDNCLLYHRICFFASYSLHPFWNLFGNSVRYMKWMVRYGWPSVSGGMSYGMEMVIRQSDYPHIACLPGSGGGGQSSNTRRAAILSLRFFSIFVISSWLGISIEAHAAGIGIPASSISVRYHSIPLPDWGTGVPAIRHSSIKKKL